MFGLVIYLYISPKLLLIRTTSKKLLDPRVKYVFLGFSNKTVKITGHVGHKSVVNHVDRASRGLEKAR